jgi:hypothetical protein
MIMRQIDRIDGTSAGIAKRISKSKEIAKQIVNRAARASLIIRTHGERNSQNKRLEFMNKPMLSSMGNFQAYVLNF